MNENAMIDVPLRWILGDPIKEDDTTDFDVWESPNGNFTGDTVRGFIEDYNYEEDDIRAEVYEYHNWCEVLVLRSRSYHRDLIAYTLIGTEEISAGTLAALEPDLANLIVRNAFIETMSL